MTTTIQSAPTLEVTRALMRERLRRVVPEFEIDLKAELAFQINQLKAERNAVILGHNYMEPALYHSVPDFVGDSLELSRVSTQTDADIIVFCGVQFMAETAKVLNPEKMVLIPSEKAGCSLAEGISAADILQLRELYPGAPVVSYVNTMASVKAESDYCCTSGNAAAVLRHILALGHKRIIFVPDEYLAHNTAAELGIPFVLTPFLRGEPAKIESEYAIIGWHARCEVHEKFEVQDIRNVRKQFPNVAVLAHPECSPEVIAEADRTGSTKQLINFVNEMKAPQYLLLTECSMGDNIAAENPDKEMLRLCSFRCPHMRQITLEDTLASLQNLQYQVELDPEIIRRAKTPIDRMLSIR